MRTQKEIIRKINSWKGNPMLVSGLYRLFTYLPWDKVPEDYKEFFPKEATEIWDDDLDSFGNKEISQDLNSEIRAILQVLVKKNITHGLGLVPMILADLFVQGIGISVFQGTLARITNEYTENILLDRDLGERLATFEVIDLIKAITIKAKLDLLFDIDKVVDQLLAEYTKAAQVNAEVDMALAVDKK